MSLIELNRKFLKGKLVQDTTSFRGYDKEREHIQKLFYRTAIEGESNSALLISRQFGGKTTLINSVLYELLHDDDFVANVMIIMLNGFIHTDDRAALKAITTQMNLDEAVEGKVFNSFSENLSFLLSCLKSKGKTKRLIFIIEEFDLFCAHHNQTLLYNLFDVAQSAQTPICVLGVTRRFDVIELLEKRVKSRFSHRQIFLHSSDDSETFLDLMCSYLSLFTPKEIEHYKQVEPPLKENLFEEIKLPFLRRPFRYDSFVFPIEYVTKWNQNLADVLGNEKVVASLQNYFDFNSNVAALKLLLTYLVSNITETHPNITIDDITKQVEEIIYGDEKVKLITGLSVLEICLLVSMKHHCDIYDNDPFNFEMILTRFNKFALKSTTMQNIERDMVLKRFENLKHQEFIETIGGVNKIQKEYQMYRLMLTPEQIDAAIAKYQNLPTEVQQWSKSSIL